MNNRTRQMLAAAAAMLYLPMVASAQSSTEKPPMKNIMEIATEAGSFNTLVAAVNVAGLAETLRGPGPFTVFAPTDAAFAKLPAGTLESLLDDTEQLSAILTYHVLSGKVTSGEIVQAKGAKPSTVNGQPLDIVLRNGKVYVNGAEVVTADIAAANGVIHVIDTVLLPKPEAAATR